MNERKMTLHGDFHIAGANADMSVDDVVKTRQNLGLGGAALLDVGTTAGTVARGDHAHGGGNVIAAQAKVAALFVTNSVQPVLSGLKVPLMAGQLYRIEAYLLMKSNLANRGLGVAVNGPLNPALLNVSICTPVSNNNVEWFYHTEYASNGTSSNLPAANKSILIRVTGMIKTELNSGDFEIMINSESSSASVSLLPGSILEVTQI